jgi:hypothetical protein
VFPTVNAYGARVNFLSSLLIETNAESRPVLIFTTLHVNLTLSVDNYNDDDGVSFINYNEGYYKIYDPYE